MYWIEGENEMEVFTSFKNAVAQIETLVEDTSCSKNSHASLLISAAQRVHKALEGIRSYKIKMTMVSRPPQKGRKKHFDINDDIEASTFESDMEVAARSVRNFFQKLGVGAGKWLIMFDNLDDICGADDFRVKWMPRSGPGNVILTTKMRSHLVPYINFRDTLGLSNDVRMESLSQDAGKRLLLFLIGRDIDTKLSDEESSAVDRIVGPSGLDGLALAIRQASLCIRHNQVSLVEYAEEFEELGPFESIPQLRGELSNSLSSS